MYFLIPNFIEILDILIITVILYQSIRYIKKTGSYQVLLLILAVFGLYLLTQWLDLKLLKYFFHTLRSYWILALIIIFQPEIRELLNKMKFASESILLYKKQSNKEFSGSLIDAISAMSFRRIGALIVLERKHKLTEFINAGELIDSLVSLRLILSLFNPKSVLHDGAIIIRNNRIISAKVILPLSKNVEYVSNFGTRHLAAIGVSEISDALTIVVSEQTGKISITENGKIQTDIAFEELMQIITDATK